MLDLFTIMSFALVLAVLILTAVTVNLIVDRVLDYKHTCGYGDRVCEWCVDAIATPCEGCNAEAFEPCRVGCLSTQAA